MTDIPSRDQIKPGTKVGIETKKDQGTGQISIGFVKNILTSSNTHPYGIKVELEDGNVGRVQELFTNTEGQTTTIESTVTDGEFTTKEYERRGPGDLDYEVGVKVTVDETDPSNNSLNVDASIPKNEDENNEFKSTYRLDLKRFEQGDGKKTENKDVEKEISITISAMANKEGGTLFVGVNDNGDILGLKNDLELLKNPNEDKFERMIWQTIKNQITDMTYVSKLGVSLIDNDSKKICVIKIPPADHPIFVHDNYAEESYVRIGSRSEKFNPSDFIKYCETRFKK
jgi:uncharacterized repeat protein (TIGR03833 family)